MRNSSLSILLISIAALSGCAVADATSNEGQTAQASTVSPDNSAFVISVGTDENPVRVSAPGTTTNICDIGSSCNFAYIAGTTLTVSTNPQNRIDCLALTRWGGACAGQGATCTVVLNSDLSTDAEFETFIRGCVPE